MARVEDVNQKLDYLEATKQQIRNAIETMGQDITDEDTFREYVDKILEITTGIKTDDATMIAEDLREGKIGYAKGEQIIGTAEFPTRLYHQETGSNTAYLVGLGYENDNWYSYAKSRLNVTQDDVLQDVRFLSETTIKTGTMPNNGELNIEPEDEPITLPAGYISGGTVNKMDITKSSDYDTCLDLSLEILGL